MLAPDPVSGTVAKLVDFGLHKVIDDRIQKVVKRVVSEANMSLGRFRGLGGGMGLKPPVLVEEPEEDELEEELARQRMAAAAAANAAVAAAAATAAVAAAAAAGVSNNGMSCAGPSMSPSSSSRFAAGGKSAFVGASEAVVMGMGSVSMATNRDGEELQNSGDLQSTLSQHPSLSTTSTPACGSLLSPLSTDSSDELRSVSHSLVTDHA